MTAKDLTVRKETDTVQPWLTVYKSTNTVSHNSARKGGKRREPAVSHPGWSMFGVGRYRGGQEAGLDPCWATETSLTCSARVSTGKGQGPLCSMLLPLTRGQSPRAQSLCSCSPQANRFTPKTICRVKTHICWP
ncbi:hypothetical protein SRHO_G00164540 [Serrasalmus rhombeus]